MGLDAVSNPNGKSEIETAWQQAVFIGTNKPPGSALVKIGRAGYSEKSGIS
jgi:hypothetical protein